MGVPISIAFSNPSITPDEKTSHPRPAIDKTIRTNRTKPNNPINHAYHKVSYKSYIVFILEVHQVLIAWKGLIVNAHVIFFWDI
jgi:hypothetical protein